MYYTFTPPPRWYIAVCARETRLCPQFLRGEKKQKICSERKAHGPCMAFSLTRYGISLCPPSLGIFPSKKETRI